MNNCFKISKSSHQRCSIKKVFLKISQNSQENICAIVSFFNKVASPRPATLLKKRLWHRCFPVNFAKFLRTPFLQSTSGHCFWIAPDGKIPFSRLKSNEIKTFSEVIVILDFHWISSFYLLLKDWYIFFEVTAFVKIFFANRISEEQPIKIYYGYQVKLVMVC